MLFPLPNIYLLFHHLQWTLLSSLSLTIEIMLLFLRGWGGCMSVYGIWMQNSLSVSDIWLKQICSRRIRDELAKQNEETTDLTTKLDKVSSRQRLYVWAFSIILLYQTNGMFCHYMQEIHSLKAQLEAAKYDVIKYCIGTIVSISAVGLAVLRIVMWSEHVHSFTHSPMETYKKRIGFAEKKDSFWFCS
jgi:hypothetical protein